MEIVYTREALKDIKYWKKQNNTIIQKKITSLLNSIESTPKLGIGNPEQLKYNFTGKWSRRINKEHRIIYEIKTDSIIIFSLKGHY